MKDIEEHEELFSIPISDLLTVQNSSLPKRLPDEFEKLDPWMSLILVMIYEAGRGQESKWGPYLHMLPSEFDTLMYWSSVELAELQGSSVVDKIGKDHANRLFLDCLLPVVKDHAGIFGKFASTFSDPDADAALLEIAHRMATLIMAYAFDLEHDGGSDESFEDDSSTAPDRPKAMVPLADIFNADGDMMNVSCINFVPLEIFIRSRHIFCNKNNQWLWLPPEHSPKVKKFLTTMANAQGQIYYGDMVMSRTTPRNGMLWNLTETRCSAQLLPTMK